MLKFIIRANKIHNNKYDYSKVIYKNNKTKIIIICHIHGEFLQTPSQHIFGKSGCLKCYNLRRGDTCRNSLNYFINTSNKIHNNKYDYSKVIYKNNKTKIIIICHIHGEFLQIPKHHLNGFGCSKCSNNYKCNTLEFIEKSRKIHNNKYDYSKVIYKNNKTKIIIICHIHGEFLQKPDNHTILKQGCLFCSYYSKGENEIEKILQKNNIEFIKQFKFKNQSHEIKNCKYDFYLQKLNTILEYHGKQHYEFNNFFHKTNDNYLYRWYLDILKKEYCLSNKINFIEIKFNENIKKRLEIENII